MASINVAPIYFHDTKTHAEILARKINEVVSNLGSASSAGLAGSTGWAFYKDSTAGQSIIADTDTLVTIDGLSASTDVSNATTVAAWNPSTNKIQAVDKSSNIFSFTFTFTPSSGASSYLDVWLDIGISFRLFNDKHNILGGNGVAHTAYQVIPAFTSSAFAANGGSIMVRSDGPGTLSDTSIAIFPGHTP